MCLASGQDLLPRRASDHFTDDSIIPDSYNRPEDKLDSKSALDRFLIDSGN